MKRAMSTVCPVFNTSRMVQEYVEKCYGPSTERFERLTLAQEEVRANAERFGRERFRAEMAAVIARAASRQRTAPGPPGAVAAAASSRPAP